MSDSEIFSKVLLNFYYVYLEAFANFIYFHAYMLAYRIVA